MGVIVAIVVHLDAIVTKERHAIGYIPPRLLAVKDIKVLFIFRFHLFFFLPCWKSAQRQAMDLFCFLVASCGFFSCVELWHSPLSNSHSVAYHQLIEGGDTTTTEQLEEKPRRTWRKLHDQWHTLQ